MASQYIPPKVNRTYRYDWQYAIDISKNSSLQFASFILFLMPLTLQHNIPIPTNLWLLWFSAVSYVVSLLIITFIAPKFVKEYRDFGDYLKRNHSHRWIVWEFHSTIKSFQRWKTILEETKRKNLSLSIESLHDSEKATMNDFANKETTTESTEIFEPINLNRDIYMPVIIEGQKSVLLLKEDDCKIKEKEKELFWILFSQAVKEKPIWRTIYWIFIYLSIFLSFLAVLHNIYKVAPTVWTHIKTILQ